MTDPFVSFDGQWVYYSYFPDLRPESLNYQRGDLPYEGADVFRFNFSHGSHEDHRQRYRIVRQLEQVELGEGLGLLLTAYQMLDVNHPEFQQRLLDALDRNLE